MRLQYENNRIAMDCRNAAVGLCTYCCTAVAVCWVPPSTINHLFVRQKELTVPTLPRRWSGLVEYRIFYGSNIVPRIRRGGPSFPSGANKIKITLGAVSSLNTLPHLLPPACVANLRLLATTAVNWSP